MKPALATERAMRRTILICLVLIAIMLVIMAIVGLLWPEPVPTLDY